MFGQFNYYLSFVIQAPHSPHCPHSSRVKEKIAQRERVIAVAFSLLQRTIVAAFSSALQKKEGELKDMSYTVMTYDNPGEKTHVYQVISIMIFLMFHLRPT